jgi:hypothetical protein
MKIYLSVIILVGSVLLINSRSASPIVAQSVAVVELFTSQGCSSCPAADKLLSEIALQAETQNEPILVLSFHVSYWNHLGWKDPYSSEAFTERQRHYSEVLQTDNIYTPQMIVNGTEEFVGSDRTRITSAITRALATPAAYAITIDQLNKQGNTLSLAYTLNESPKDELLYAALVINHAENQVPRGENAGKLLKHDNVVMTLDSFPLGKTGQLKLSIPASTNPSGYELILFIQERNSLKIVGATRLKLRLNKR